jgi:hypothetical protein
MKTNTLIVVALMLLASNLLAADFVELKDVSGKHTIKEGIKYLRLTPKEFGVKQCRVILIFVTNTTDRSTFLDR